VQVNRIAIIGAGNVGGALYRCLKGTFPEDALILCDSHEDPLIRTGASHVTRDANEAAHRADALVVAVKPQSFADLARSMTAPLAGRLVITVMAGVQLQTVAAALQVGSVVRAMPNLGAQVGRGVTAWIAAPACTPMQLALARRIFAAAGTGIEVHEESLLDAFTALGGSGPAYYFYLTELLAENAVAMGFDPQQAWTLAREVLSASARLVELGDRTPGEWRKAVTTPGGTTEAAMQSFQERGLAEVFRAGLEAARDRSAALNRG
jgi:pyrroline-5-carboxylate reductase